MNRKRAIGLGAGGNARSVLDALKVAGEVDVVGLLDNDPGAGTLDGVPVLGDDSLLPDLVTKGIDVFFVGLGGGGMLAFSGRARQKVFDHAVSLGLSPLTVIHPSAVISPSATIRPGACVLAAAVINAGAEIGEGALINTGAIVEHDCRIAAHAHVATGARLAGAVSVGTMAHIGAGAVIRQGLRIGDGAVVGIGAAVVRDVDAGMIVAGIPARPIRREVP